jgi:hypothetical protein
MPVAALILIRPRVEVKAIEGDSLGADGDGRQARAHVAIETIFVHAQVGGRVAQSDEVRQERRRYGETARWLRERTS